MFYKYYILQILYVITHFINIDTSIELYLFIQTLINVDLAHKK